ncbi:hypothetical protein EI77_03766 [Prosthecobacter fusiformis]|uniref:Uncharacterized protein n=2 Tax=Prosthecobacter fusiformis TaxID=48464 RepID=A0A4R7RL27_9BACT|nr:hypothetical protein EI77_03766 [Prosthecobacter fusiformis]
MLDMTESEFNSRVTRLCQVLGCSKDLATDYVQAMGDSPVVEHGKVIVRDPQGHIIARVSASILEG